MAALELDSVNGDDVGSSERARRNVSWFDYAESLGYGSMHSTPSQKEFDPDPGDVH